MSANLVLLRAGASARGVESLYPDARSHSLLAILLAVNLAVVGAAFAVENTLWPWRVRMDTTTPGWCLVLAQASTLGFVTALALRSGWASVAQGLMAATLVGYAYVLAGAHVVDPRRPLQLTQLIYRALELGMVSVGSLMLGASMRLLLRQELVLSADDNRSAPRFGLADLLFLMIVFAVGLGMANLFLDHFDRDAQLFAVVLALVRSLPATLPWLWGVTQRRLSPTALLLIIASSILLLLLKVFFEWSARGELTGEMWQQAGRRAMAYAVAGTANGLALRGMGFRWK
jgi:hypothetical protein